MKRLISCEFNIDTARVELKYSDGSMLAINCYAVEDEYARTIRQRFRASGTLCAVPSSFSRQYTKYSSEKRELS